MLNTKCCLHGSVYGSSDQRVFPARGLFGAEHTADLRPSTYPAFAMSGNRIMVGNLPYEADERAISDALGHLGHITDCKVRIDR